jgi:hypothetical protein
VTEPLGKAVVEIVADRAAFKANLAAAETEFRDSMNRIAMTARAAQIFKETRTDFEKYRAAQSEINDMRAAGVGDADALLRKEQQLREAYIQTTAVFRQRIEAEKEAEAIRGRHMTPEGRLAGGREAVRGARADGGLDAQTAAQEIQRLNAAYREQKLAVESLDDANRLSKLTYSQLKAEQTSLVAEMKVLTAAFREGKMSAEQYNAAKRSLNVSLDTIGQTFATGSAAANRYGLLMQQASFGAQDFLTVLSMGGGLNMALMSASNNLAQVASMINPLIGAYAGMAIVVGSVLIPQLVKLGQTYIDTRPDEILKDLAKQKDAVDEVASAYDRLEQRLKAMAGGQESGRRMDSLNSSEAVKRELDQLKDREALLRASIPERESLAQQAQREVEAAGVRNPVTGKMATLEETKKLEAERDKRQNELAKDRTALQIIPATRDALEKKFLQEITAERRKEDEKELKERREKEEKAAKEAIRIEKEKRNIIDDMAIAMNPEAAERLKIEKSRRDRDEKLDELGIGRPDILRRTSADIEQMEKDKLAKKFESDLLRDADPTKAKREDIVAKLDERLKFIGASDLSGTDKRRQAEMAQQAAERGLGDIGRKKAEGPGFAGIADLSSQIQMAIKPKDSTAKAQESTAENTKKTAEYLKIVKEKVETLESGFGP